MTKDRLICFRTSKDLHDIIVHVAKEDRRSLSSTIEILLTNYLKESKILQCVTKERRHFPRKALSVPVLIHQYDLGEISLGSISDISLDGLSIIIPKDCEHQFLIDSQCSRFEIVFNSPPENKPIILSCESKRVIDIGDSIHVGVSIVNVDFKSYKALKCVFR